MTGTTKTCQQCHTTKCLADFSTVITCASWIPLRINRSINDICRVCENSNLYKEESDSGFLEFGFNWFTAIVFTIVILTGLAGYLSPAFMATWFFKIIMGIFIVVILLNIFAPSSNNE